MAAPPWTNVWDETKPADSDLANTLGTQGRQVKLDLRQRMAYQHVWNKDVNTDGAHINLILSDPDTAANTPILKSGGYSLTGSDVHPAIDISGVWNTSGVVSAIRLNITNTASGAGSLLLDLQIAGSSKFVVDKLGNVVCTGTVTANGVTLTPGAYTTGIGAVTTIAPGGSVGTPQTLSGAIANDGWIWGFVQGSSGSACSSTLASDTNNPSTTLLVSAQSGAASGTATNVVPFMIPVKKGERYTFTITAGDSNCRFALFYRPVS